MTNIGLTPRDVARELARRYSTMTHDELDMLEGILVPMKFQKCEYILREGRYAKISSGLSRDWCDSSIIKMVKS